MCRIYGYLNATVAPHDMRAVAALQRHGGPDGTGMARALDCGVGCNRLAVVDPGGGRQPYTHDGRVQVVFNGEIYNHDELRSRLERMGHTFRDRCDGGILPAMYREYGDDFVEHLDGMFGVAVLDLRGTAPRLLLATDDIGMKPLYYRWDEQDRSLLFSSELPALLGFPGQSARPWEAGLDSYLTTRTPFGEQTLFEGVRTVPPATTMVCTAGGQPTATQRKPRGELPPEGEEAAAAEVRGLLRREVRRLLVADVPVAVITSGGLDSSLVTAMAADEGPVHSFNIAYRGDWPSDERHFAREVARRSGTTHHQVVVDPADFPALLQETVWHLGQPNSDPIALSSHALFAAVRAAGFTVALTGDGADEVFGGYDRMRAAARAAADGRDWSGPYLDALAAVPARLRNRLYTDAYRDHVGPLAAIPATARDELLHGAGTVLERITRFELGYRLPAYHLRRVDHLSMASSIEVRLPYCQRDVVALGRSLPDALRTADGRPKRTLYAAAAGLLPDSVLNRPKQPFTLPVTAMLVPGAPLWEFARDMLDGARLRHGGQLRPDAVEELFDTQARRPDDTAASALWALLVYEVWRDQFQRSRHRPAATGPLRLPETTAVAA